VPFLFVSATGFQSICRASTPRRWASAPPAALADPGREVS
jgi:hypothetical protein